MDKQSRPAREAVLNAAIETFALRGYNGTTIVDIMMMAQCSKPTLYYYFKSKPDLYRGILNFAYDESFKRMQDSVEGKAGLEERLTSLVSALFEFARSHKNLMRLVFTTAFAAPGEMPPKSIDPARRRRSFHFMEELIREAKARGEVAAEIDTEEMSLGFFGIVGQHIRTHLLSGKLELDEARGRRIVALFLNGARRKI